MKQPSSEMTVWDPEALQAEAAYFSSEEKQFLETMNARVAGGVSLSKTLDFVVDQSRALFPCDRLSVAFMSDDGLRLVSHWTRAAYTPVLLGPGYAQGLRESSLAPLLRTGAIRVIHDFEGYLKKKPSSQSTRLLVQEGVLSSMTLPLVVEGRRVGFLFRSARKRDAYGRRHALLHQRIADRLNQAVEKAWRIEQLERAQHAREEILRFVSHELKSPLASIIMDGQLLAGGYLGDLTEKQGEKIKKMTAKAEHLLGFVQRFLQYSRVESEGWQPTFAAVDFMEAVLTPTLELVEAQRREKGITITINAPNSLPPVTCDAELIRIVMVNLVANGIKYGDENGTVRLSVASEAGRLRIGVWNSGPGFPASEQHRLFQPFSRLRSPALSRKPGTGIGLYTCWRIVEAHHGAIAAASLAGQWAEFRLELPLAQETETLS